MDGRLTRITNHTYRGTLHGWVVTVSSAGGWHCHVCPVGCDYSARCFAAGSLDCLMASGVNSAKVSST